MNADTDIILPRHKDWRAGAEGAEFLIYFKKFVCSVANIIQGIYLHPYDSIFYYFYIEVD